MLADTRGQVLHLSARSSCSSISPLALGTLSLPQVSRMPAWPFLGPLRQAAQQGGVCIFQGSLCKSSFEHVRVTRGDSRPHRSVEGMCGAVRDDAGRHTAAPARTSCGSGQGRGTSHPARPGAGVPPAPGSGTHPCRSAAAPRAAQPDRGSAGSPPPPCPLGVPPDPAHSAEAQLRAVQGFALPCASLGHACARSREGAPGTHRVCGAVHHAWATHTPHTRVQAEALLSPPCPAPCRSASAHSLTCPHCFLTFSSP